MLQTIASTNATKKTTTNPNVCCGSCTKCALALKPMHGSCAVNPSDPHFSTHKCWPNYVECTQLSMGACASMHGEMFSSMKHFKKLQVLDYAYCYPGSQSHGGAGD